MVFGVFHSMLSGAVHLLFMFSNSPVHSTWSGNRLCCFRATMYLISGLRSMYDGLFFGGALVILSQINAKLEIETTS